MYPELVCIKNGSRGGGGDGGSGQQPVQKESATWGKAATHEGRWAESRGQRAKQTLAKACGVWRVYSGAAAGGRNPVHQRQWKKKEKALSVPAAAGPNAKEVANNKLKVAGESIAEGGDGGGRIQPPPTASPSLRLGSKVGIHLGQDGQGHNLDEPRGGSCRENTSNMRTWEGGVGNERSLRGGDAADANTVWAGIPALAGTVLG